MNLEIVIKEYNYNMKRTDIINHLIEKFGFNSYLEIGVQFPNSNYDLINVKNKAGVEPFPVGDWKDNSVIIKTSDEFFNNLDKDIKYDIIFIDGLHTREQCLKDILNSLNHLSDNGFILVHDCLPTAEYQTSIEDNGREWTGPVWKSIVDIKEKDGLDICTIDTDWGVGCIRKDKSKSAVKNNLELNWDDYNFYKQELLNIKSIDEWIKSL